MNLNNISNRIVSTARSRGFYRFVLIFFVIEAAWIALTAAYPQAFDEQYHFGLIQVYAHYPLPFLSHQPPGANQFGAVARDPSYLYHYLMSFPYRLIELFTSRQAYQVIALRFLNIALFTAGLVLFRKVLIKSKLTVGMANIILFIFVLIPIVPQLAGQINYDNMLLPLVALVCLLSFRMIDEVRKLELSFRTTSLMLITATLASLVKYAFLPIFLAVIIFFVFYIWRYYRHKLSTLGHYFIIDFKKQALWLKLVLVGGLIISAGMFIQRDGINLVRYHTIDPDCAGVLNIKSCSAYSVWYSDFTWHQSVVSKQTIPSHDPIVYGGQWLYWMWYRMFFAINGPTTSYTNYPPLPLPSAIALVIGLFGLFAVIKYRRELFRANAYAGLLLTASIVYLIALFVQGYSSYQFTDVLENMNGRYLLPVLLLGGAILAQAIAIALKKRAHVKVLIAVVIVLLFLEGGGVLTYIDRSDDSWYWQNSKAVKANSVAKKITKKIVVSGKKGYATPLWFFN